MPKALYIAEKPSVAREFAKALGLNFRKQDGYMEADQAVVTWCVGHLVTMSYPEAYDEKYKKWSLSTLPFLPQEWKYEVIPGVKKQYQIVAGLLNRQDIDTIYVCTDSGREGEYIYRLVEQQAKVRGKSRRRVWIDSQTEEEILRGIREAKDLSEYDSLCASAYLRAKEDYLMGINFSRLLSLKYSDAISSFLKTKYTVVSVGRVMTCVQGMVVRREREIRSFVKTPFYRVVNTLNLKAHPFEGEWRAVEGSAYFQSPRLYKENGWKQKADAEQFIAHLIAGKPMEDLRATVHSIEKRKETKKPPLLYNLAELQNDCSRLFKISPDQTLQIVQELYEKKMVTYPRTDARVLSSAVAKEIHKNIEGLKGIAAMRRFTEEILHKKTYQNIAKTRYVNDKQITDHYAIIPTGQGLSAARSLNQTALHVYEVIVRRFLSIFYPPAVYQKVTLVTAMELTLPAESQISGRFVSPAPEISGTDVPAKPAPAIEKFFSALKVLADPGYLQVMEYSFQKKKSLPTQASQQSALSPAQEGTLPISQEGTLPAPQEGLPTSAQAIQQSHTDAGAAETGATEGADSANLLKLLSSLKKGMELPVTSLTIKEGETSPPKRYNSGSMILAMENAGQLIEDEELRAQIKGSGIGTSATRAEILKKLVNNKYLALNGKTQIITPTLLGEIIYDVVNASIRSLLNPELTASWEKGLGYVAEGTITSEEYMDKLEHFVRSRTNNVLKLNNQYALRNCFQQSAAYYKPTAKDKKP
ncbi:MAG: type IA DNA topoisomerase [Lachnospiraceae bacterium]|nr:type IA DNA topoisomerase [Lachnospiraceae bacterium]